MLRPLTTLGTLLILLLGVAIAYGQNAGDRDPQRAAELETKQKRSAEKAEKKAAEKKAAEKRAAERKTLDKRTTEKNQAARRPDLAEQAKQVTRFVDRHLPELAELLEVLEEAEPSRHRAAVRELYLAIERLERLKRDPQLYQLGLKSWKLEKQAQLLAARIRMDDSAENEGELKRLLDARYLVELQILQHNRDKLAARLKKMDADLERRKRNHRREVDRLVNSWLRGKSQRTKPVATRKATDRGTSKKQETKAAPKAKNK